MISMQRVLARLRRGSSKKYKEKFIFISFGNVLYFTMSNRVKRKRNGRRLTDQEVIREIKNGNHAAYKKIILKYQSQIAATVIGMLGNTMDAEDVGQEVFIRFFRSLGKFRGESSIGTYLTRIAINLSINELKRRRRRKWFFIEPKEYDIENLTGENEKLDSDEKEFVNRAIQRLDNKFRSVVVLRLIDGYSTKETAEILKIPHGTVLSRLARAQEKLKEILSPIMEESNG
jgi:RNA polymerase sigma-70 factor (ECF subfamily)